MIKLTTYKLRTGNAIPLICDGSSTSEGIIIFAFGTETQNVFSCSFTHSVVKSADMCLLGGEFYSANYKGYSGKVDDKLTYSSNLTDKPEFSPTYSDTCGLFLSGDF